MKRATNPAHRCRIASIFLRTVVVGGESHHPAHEQERKPKTGDFFVARPRAWAGSFEAVPPAPFGTRSTASVNDFNLARHRTRFAELGRERPRQTRRAMYVTPLPPSLAPSPPHVARRMQVRDAALQDGA